MTTGLFGRVPILVYGATRFSIYLSIYLFITVNLRSAVVALGCRDVEVSTLRHRQSDCGRRCGALGAQSSAKPCGDACRACQNHTSTVQGCGTCLRLIGVVSLRGAG